MNSLIKKYINLLTIHDIDKFALKNNILLNKQELNVLYDNVKHNIDEIVNNSEKVFLKIKDKITNENYNKIHNLFDEYKKKYKDYL